VTPPDTPPRPEGPSTEPELEAAPGADERALIQRCIEGDASAFEPLVERYRQRVWRLAYQILRDKEEAWDCAQEAFVRAFHSLPSFRGQSAFYTWLFRITVNVATDRQRARGAQARAFGADRVPEEEWRRTTPDPTAGPDKAALQAEQRERIRHALDALPPKARTIIMLSDIEGLSYREIAEVLRCPIGTVMSRLHNARKRLKAALGSMLAVVLFVVSGLLLAAAPGNAQPVIRFGVRVLEASNTGTPEGGSSPGSAPGQRRPVPPPPPPPGAPPPPPPSGMPLAPRAAPGTETDERLRSLLPQLRSVFRYSEYTQLARHRVDGPLGVMQRFSIPGDRWLDITPDQLLGKAVRMQVRLLKGEQAEMNASLLASPGAPAVLGGPAYGKGVLIIILWANPNPGPDPSPGPGRSP